MSVKSNIKQSIVIGAVNEAGIVADSLEIVQKWLSKANLLNSTEVVVVTAEGTDDTPEIVKNKIKIFPHHQHILPGPRVGKGRDIQKGVLAAKGEKVLYMDADLATPLDHITTMLAKLEQGAAVVIGVRDIAVMHKTFFRKITSIASNFAVKVLIWQNISDTQCGFKGFSKEAAQKLFSQQKNMGWSFDAEILALAKKAGYKIEQIQIKDWSDPKPEGEGLVGDSQIKAMINSLHQLSLVRLNLIFRRYK